MQDPYKPQDAHNCVPYQIHKTPMVCSCNMDACATKIYSKVVWKNIVGPGHGGGTCPTPK
jgi:hypothetical protein